MRVCICDDIEEYRNSIRLYTENFFKCKQLDCQIDEFAYPKEVLSEQYEKYDIFFVDIEFDEDENGIDFIKQLNKVCNNSYFIIVTSYNQYLDQAFDLKVLRFINKPIQQDRISSALEKAINEINHSVISFKISGSEKIFINKKLIIYAEAKHKKTYIVTVEKEYYSPIPFRDFKEKLNSSDFLIPHNSYIVNKNYICGFKRNFLTVQINKGKVLIPISATKQSLIRKQFQEK